MIKKVPLVIFIMISLVGFGYVAPKNNNLPSKSLNEWLAKDISEREPLESLDFAKIALSKNEAANAMKLLLADKQAQMLKEYKTQWDNRILSYNGYNMPFYYNVFGDKPADGRSLFISLHGGGGAPASVNDQQYDNQKHLYDETMLNLEGVYFVPRAPTDTWNLWHQDHIDIFLNIIIQMAVIKLDVSPDKVYIMGYSAGGDGVYQLAPRMADRWAAASMMAGHPNDASPLSLRNIPFSIHVGALDDAYSRNTVAGQWGGKLDELQLDDPNGYIHNVQIHEGKAHWMNKEDAVALPSMRNYKRNPIPTKVVWMLNKKLHNSFYWLSVPENKRKENTAIRAEYNKTNNEINIIENSCETIQLWANDKMLDLDKSVTIKYQGNIIGKGVFARTILNIYQSINTKGDPGLAFTCAISVVNNEKIVK